MERERRIVTLDGPAGVGKTTMAKRVAKALDIAYLDTGAMFRGTALFLGKEGPGLDEAGLAARLAGLRFELSNAGSESLLLMNGRPLGEEIRTEAVGMLASTLATRPSVRAFQKEAQQAIGRDIPLVAEGRDMGTVVFPQAAHKFFLEAAPGVRALRRRDQLAAMGQEAPEIEALTAQIERRDTQDRTRAEAPLKPADDAVIIDTTLLDADQVFAAIMERITG